MPIIPPELKTEHLERSTRILHKWNPQKIRTAKILADGGNLMVVADLCEDIMADDSMNGVLEARVRGLFGLPLVFDPSGDARRKTPITKALETDFWQMNPEHELNQAWTWAVLLGVGVTELVGREREGRVLPRIVNKQPRYLRYDWNARGWMLDTQDQNLIPITPGDGKWVMFTPYGERRPWAYGAWRSVALWWLLKQYAFTDWARYSEVRGKGILAGTMPESKAGDVQARKDLAADLADLGDETSVALPPGYDLKLVESTANTYQTFEKQIQMADEGIAVAILGQNLTTRVSSGSHAAAKVQNEVRSDLRRGDAGSISTTLRDQQIVYWAEWNFGNADLAPYPKWQTEPPQDLVQTADTFQKVAGALPALTEAGADARAILEQFGIPLATTPPPVPADPAPQLSSDPVTLAAQPNNQPSRPAGTQAFIDGQLYMDALGDHGLSLNVLAPTVRAVLEAVDGASDYQNLRDRLLDLYPRLNADQATEMLRRALMLAELAGRYAGSLEQPDPAIPEPVGG